MIHSVRFICVLDTNVIYPLEIRDLLFWFAHAGLYTVKWSQHIFDEWEEVMRRLGVAEDEIQRRTNRANLAFPDALVENYEPIMPGLNLPDEKDRHVLAAAIKSNAHIIVTNNLSDFPAEYLARFGLSAKSADAFLSDIIDLNQDKSILAFRELVVNRRHPDMDEWQVLEAIRKNGLTETAYYLHSLL